MVANGTKSPFGALYTRAMNTERLDAVGPWAKEKLEALARYLDFYTKVLKNQRWRTIYVDAYAGSGRAALRQSVRDVMSLLEDEPDAGLVEYINGSPRVALGIANPFARYVLIEPDPGRAARLEALRDEYRGSRQIDVLRQDAASGIEWLLTQNIGRNTHRGVGFLDPFGADLDWAVIQALANTRVFEVAINFTLNMAIQRMLPNSGEFQPGWRDRLDAYFGTSAWYGAVYEDRAQLFGTRIEKRPDYLENLLELYRGRLKEAFGYVSQAKVIQNTRGVPLYYLLWAGPNRKGLEGANYILSMGERLPRGARQTKRAPR
jgi:three-Cys-motif partner protein